MTFHYSILMLDAEGEVTGSASCAVATDEAALLTAQAWLSRHPAVEVWKGTRVVATLVAGARSKPHLESVAQDPDDHFWPDADFHPPIA